MDCDPKGLFVVLPLTLRALSKLESFQICFKGVQVLQQVFLMLPSLFLVLIIKAFKAFIHFLKNNQSKPSIIF